MNKQNEQNKKQPQTYIHTYATDNRLRKLDRKSTERKCKI